MKRKYRSFGCVYISGHAAALEIIDATEESQRGAEQNRSRKFVATLLLDLPIDDNLDIVNIL